ncbi:hypothetical protein PG987_013188 [Apiospora arundinis]
MDTLDDCTSGNPEHTYRQVRHRAPSPVDPEDRHDDLVARLGADLGPRRRRRQGQREEADDDGRAQDAPVPPAVPGRRRDLVEERGRRGEVEVPVAVAPRHELQAHEAPRRLGGHAGQQVEVARPDGVVDGEGVLGLARALALLLGLERLRGQAIQPVEARRQGQAQLDEGQHHGEVGEAVGLVRVLPRLEGDHVAEDDGDEGEEGGEDGHGQEYAFHGERLTG